MGSRHKNSLECYRDLDVSPREKEIYELLQKEYPLTDRQITLKLGYSDMNSTRPRISEMIKRCVLEECADVIDFRTGKLVRTVKINKNMNQPTLL